jgi:hypothetical protein
MGPILESGRSWPGNGARCERYRAAARYAAGSIKAHRPRESPLNSCAYRGAQLTRVSVLPVRREYCGSGGVGRRPEVHFPKTFARCGSARRKKSRLVPAQGF